MDKLLKYNGVQEALKFLREDDERTLQEHLEMCQIPAPSYEEGEKAEYVRKKMVDAGLSEVHVDEVGNVLGTWKGTGNGPRIMVAGHTDTVFPRETDLTLKKEGERYSCPGIGDQGGSGASQSCKSNESYRHSRRGRYCVLCKCVRRGTW